MTNSKIEDKFHLRNSSVLIGLFAALMTFVWPMHLASDRAFAAISPDFDIHPNATAVHGSLVEQKLSAKTTDISFHFQGHVYRAKHAIQQWNAHTASWSDVSGNITQNNNAHADGYKLDHVTAIATGNLWYAGTLVGNVMVGRPSTGWTQSKGLPERTVTAIAELPNDSNVAVVGYGGYSSATPNYPGHVYVTLDGGRRWFDISGNLPDTPVSALRFGSATSNWTLKVKLGKHWYKTTQQGQWTSA